MFEKIKIFFWAKRLPHSCDIRAQLAPYAPTKRVEVKPKIDYKAILGDMYISPEDAAKLRTESPRQRSDSDSWSIWTDEVSEN